MKLGIQGNIAIEVCLKTYNSKIHECNYEKYKIINYNSNNEPEIIGDFILLFTSLKSLVEKKEFDKINGLDNNNYYKNTINKQFKYLYKCNFIKFATSQLKKNSDIFFLITDLEIKEKYRGKGIGSFAINFLINNIVERVNGFLSLIAINNSIENYPDNKHLIKFYKRFNFNQFETNKNILYLNLLTNK